MYNNVGNKTKKEENDVQQWLPDGNLILMSKKLYNKEAKLLWAWRETPSIPKDSGWRLLSTEDTTESLRQSSTVFLPYETVLTIQPAIAFIFYYPVGADFQFTEQGYSQHFAYNDTYEYVKPAKSIQGLPFKDYAFQSHFSLFIEDFQKAREKKKFCFHWSDEELRTLNELNRQLFHFYNVLMGTRKTPLKVKEDVLLIGLGLGFLFKKCQIKNIIFLEEEMMNVVAHSLFIRFNCSLDQTKQTIIAYWQATKTAPIAKQLMQYGVMMATRIDNKSFEAVHKEYQRLCAHYLEN